MPHSTDILSVLQHLGAPIARTLGAEARRAFVEASRADDPVQQLRRGARATGLELRPYRLSLRALSVGAPALPLVQYSAAHAGYYVVEAVRRGQLHVRVFSPDGPGPATWVHPDVLGAAQGVDAGAELELFHPVPSRPLEALKGAESEWRRLWQLLRSERRDLWVVFVYAVGVGGLSLATPLAVQSLIDIVSFGTLLQPLVVLGLLLMAALTASAMLRLFEIVVVELISRRVFVRTAVDFSRRLPLARRDKGPGHYEALLNHFYDVVTVEKSLSALLSDGLAASLQIGVGLLLLAVYHPLLLAFDLLLVLIIGVIIFVAGRKAVDTSLLESKSKHAVAAWLEVLAGTPAAFRSVTGQRYAQAHADEVVQVWLQYRADHFRILLRQMGGMLGLQATASALLVLIGGFLVLEGQLTLGQLVAAEVIMTLTVSALGKLGRLFAKVYDLLAALQKIGSVVDLPLSESGGEALPSQDGPLHLRLEHPTLHLDVAPGAHVAVAGAELVDAHGLVEWIAGLRPMAEGQLHFAGVDARALDAAEVAERIAVLDKREIFEGTVRDNVTLGDGEATSGRVRDALARVGLEGLEQSLPKGLDTRLGRDGEPLGDARCALLQVARAVARRPQLVVVDRLLDDLPPASRDRALDVLLAEDAPWTTICVTDQADVLERFSRHVTAQSGGSRPAPRRASP